MVLEYQGCYIATPSSLEVVDSSVYPSWCFGFERLEGDFNRYPDIGLDDESGMMTVINAKSFPQTYYISVSDCAAVKLADGSDALEVCKTFHGNSYVTFILLLFPKSRIDLCKLVPHSSTGDHKRSMKKMLSKIRILSDIQEFQSAVPQLPGYNLDLFPLAANFDGEFLCTQASGGRLTHFAHPSTYHAIDFRCPIGTPVLAIFDCLIVDLRNDSSNSGVHVSDLFNWNSVMIKAIDKDLYCEYVHVKRNSMRFKIGDMVKKGSIVCETGNVGFCPEPHLHMELHASKEPGAESIPILYEGLPFKEGTSYP